MLKTEVELEYTVASKSKESFPAIILSAGRATRMNGIDKNFLELCSVPVIARTVAAFDKSERICEIVVVTRGDKTEELRSILSSYDYRLKITVTEGGSCREESALRGIEALGGRYKKTIIHDGARPFVDEGIISRVADALETNDSVSCGVPEKSTIKVVNEDWLVVKTLRRDALVSLQTPQGVAIAPFVRSAAENDLSVFTDDTSVVEAVGVRTQIVNGSYKNMKITTPEDVKLAELYLQDEGEL